MSDGLIAAVTALAEATQAQAQATRELAAQHERLWLALPPRTRAKLLGISPRQERNRRRKAELLSLTQ